MASPAASGSGTAAAVPTLLPISLVVAATESWGIGKAGALPWSLPADMAFFKRVTSECAPGRQNAVIMGRKTWASIPPRFRPLRGRLNVVLSTSEDVRAVEGIPDEVLVASSLTQAVSVLATSKASLGLERVFLIGGAAAYAEALASSAPVAVDTVHLTRVFREFECDVFIPPVDEARFALAGFEVRAVMRARVAAG